MSSSSTSVPSPSSHALLNSPATLRRVGLTVVARSSTQFYAIVHKDLEETRHRRSGGHVYLARHGVTDEEHHHWLAGHRRALRGTAEVDCARFLATLVIVIIIVLLR